MAILLTGACFAQEAPTGKNGKARGLVPASLSNWHIKIGFAGGAPLEREIKDTFELNIWSNGAAKFENLREFRKKRATFFAGKLDKDETARVFQAAAAAVNGFDISEGDAKNGDGWDVTLTLSAYKYGSMQRSVQISINDIDSLRDAGPEISAIFELLNKHLGPGKKIRLDRD